MIGSVLLATAVGLAANEIYAVSPWCADKLARWSASRRYADPERAVVRAEELAALIGTRPGNLLKLVTAIRFAGAALSVSGKRLSARIMVRALGCLRTRRAWLVLGPVLAMGTVIASIGWLRLFLLHIVIMGSIMAVPAILGGIGAAWLHSYAKERIFGPRRAARWSGDHRI